MIIKSSNFKLDIVDGFIVLDLYNFLSHTVEGFIVSDSQMQP